MAEGNMMKTYVGIGAGVSFILLIIALATLAIKRLKKKAIKRDHEGIKIIQDNTPMWYDPQLVAKVPEQVGEIETHLEEGLLAVLTNEKRARSAECLMRGRADSVASSNLESCKSLSASANSLCSLFDERSLFDQEGSMQSLTLKSSPYIEFNLLWASGSSSLSVYVIRITSLPPSYTNATCSYKVTLNKPDDTSISKTSNKVRKVSLNPDCLQVFSFPVTLEEAQQSELELEVLARKSKHFLSKSIGQLQYQLPRNMIADKPVTTSQPVSIHKKRVSSFTRSPKESISGQAGTLWGEIQVLAQYQLTGRWQGRIKIMIIKGHTAIVSKDSGSYKVEVIVKKGSETMTVLNTKGVRGPKPVWKTPFIFDVTLDKVDEYRVELSLLRVSRVKQSTTIGIAVLGLNTSPTGHQHWQDIVAKPNKEITMWHPITYED